ncbi:phospholipase A [Vibrio tapetis subsp. quintayensis]|uniref:phospholipase A n=1 Tax=Vibrio tapetis TaxID=52443 RepID=UPI0025B56746|nr:phospholipase A [Vibrio tapetis]MDN3679955.1 phospholipase A [Vibrio tapetis subsp. quintayensis]
MKYKVLLAAILSPLLQAKSLSTISSYEDTYVIGSHTSSVNREVYQNGGFDGAEQLQPFEVKFQFSFSVPLFQLTSNSSIAAAYTQTSLWQVANNQISSPFRETNYKPQVFVMYRPNLFFLNNIEFGYKHESNGQTAKLSRSWDRAYIALELLDGPFEYGLQAWSVIGRIGENPDIADYYAPWEAWTKLYTGAGVFDARGFYNFDTKKSGVELGYTFYFNELIGIYGQVYHGYGETLIEYDHSHTRVGLGLKLVNWQ